MTNYTLQDVQVHLAGPRFQIGFTSYDMLTSMYMLILEQRAQLDAVREQKLAGETIAKSYRETADAEVSRLITENKSLRDKIAEAHQQTYTLLDEIADLKHGMDEAAPSMTDKDTVIGVKISLARDGTLTYASTRYEAVAAYKVVVMGMLAAVTSLYSREFEESAN